MLQNPTIQAAIYIKDHVLPADLEGMIRNLGRLALDRRTRRRMNSLVRNATLEMPPTHDAIAKISVTQRRIQLPYGCLAARWCSTYRTCGLLNGAVGFDAFRQAAPVGDTFTWPSDVPAPDQATEEVANVNKIFPYVLFATVLHEIGHIVHRERRVFGVRLELACDAFAMDYYIQSYRSENLKTVALGLAIWVCCLCSESLFFTEHKSRSYPSPARRMEQLFARHLSR